MAESFSYGEEMSAFGNALEGSLLPKGDYELTVLTAPPGLTSKQNHCFKLTYRIDKGPMLPPDPTAKPPLPARPTTGMTVTGSGTWLTWSPSSEIAARIFYENMGKLGAPGRWIKSTNPTEEQIAERIVGARIAAGIEPNPEFGNNKVSIRKQIATGPKGLPLNWQPGAADGAPATNGNGTPAVPADMIPAGAPAATPLPPVGDDDWP